MRILLLTALAAALALTATGCRDKHKPDPATAAASAASSRNKAIAECQSKGMADFRTLSIAGKGLADIPGLGEGVGFSYRIAIDRDRAILIRVNKLIEVARVYITPDSIVTLDRLKNVAYITGFDVARSYTGLDADFALLQDLITGSLNVIPDTMALKGKANGTTSYSGLRQGVAFEYDLNGDCHPLRIEAQNPARQQHTRISYPTFEHIGKTHFAKAVNVEIIEPKKATFALTHNSILPDEDGFAISFSIPEGYAIERDLKKP